MRFTSLIVFVTAASALSTQVSYHSRDGQSTENADIYNWIKRGDQSADDADIYNWIKRDGESADKRSGTYGEHIGEVPTLANISPWSSTYWLDIYAGGHNHWSSTHTRPYMPS